MIKFVNINFETIKVQIEETFIDFIQIKEKDIASVEKTVGTKLETNGFY